jgi:hypothetical protein
MFPSILCFRVACGKKTKCKYASEVLVLLDGDHVLILWTRGLLAVGTDDLQGEIR